MNRRGNFSPSRQYKIGRGEGGGEQIFARTSSLVHQTHFPFPEQKSFFFKKDTTLLSAMFGRFPASQTQTHCRFAYVHGFGKKGKKTNLHARTNLSFHHTLLYSGRAEQAINERGGDEKITRKNICQIYKILAVMARSAGPVKQNFSSSHLDFPFLFIFNPFNSNSNFFASPHLNFPMLFNVHFQPFKFKFKLFGFPTPQFPNFVHFQPFKFKFKLFCLPSP